MAKSRVLEADFVTSVAKLEQLPEGDVPEVAVLGRSNVGKSSFLNALCERKSLAKTSRTPGRTQMLNFFFFRYRYEDEDRVVHLVDFPGYGYAKVPAKQRRDWIPYFEKYLVERDNLSLVILLVDSRRKPGEEELYLAEMGREGNLIVVLTKTDKLNRREKAAAKKSVQQSLGLSSEQIFCASTLPKKVGIDEIRDAVVSHLP